MSQSETASANGDCCTVTTERNGIETVRELLHVESVERSTGTEMHGLGDGPLTIDIEYWKITLSPEWANCQTCLSILLDLDVRWDDGNVLYVRVGSVFEN